MFLTELFDNLPAAGSTGTKPTVGTNKPKTAAELHRERNAEREAKANTVKKAFKRHATKTSNRPEDSDGDEMVDK